MHGKLAGEFIRYTVVGQISFYVDYGVLLLLSGPLGMHYLAAAAIGFVLGTLLNYVGSTRYAFRSRSLSNRNVERILFLAIGLLGLALLEGLLFLLTGKLAVPVVYSKPAAQVVVFFWNFAARKAFLFSDAKRGGRMIRRKDAGDG